jgi:ADP-heptose:LPS heptosyltransferase
MNQKGILKIFKEIMNIQFQSGLGDLIMGLPYIEKLQPDVTIATNHRYALEPFGNTVKTELIEFNGILPIAKENFQYLKYTRYGVPYRDIYFQGDDYELYVKKVRDRYNNFYNSKLNIEDEFIIFSPPHAAKRHQHKKYIYECTPDITQTYNLIFSLRNIVVLVGKDDIYPDLPDMQNVIDLRNKTTFFELCSYIKQAKTVISQIGAITAIAGLFGVPTIYLPAAKETSDEHTAHINGVIWPGQKICTV